LSKPLTDKPSDNPPSAGDWFILIDATDVNAARSAISGLENKMDLKSAVISKGIYRLMWDISKNEIPL
jgi:hypothetical protein